MNNINVLVVGGPESLDGRIMNTTHCPILRLTDPSPCGRRPAVLTVHEYRIEEICIRPTQGSSEERKFYLAVHLSMTLVEAMQDLIWRYNEPNSNMQR